MWMGISAHLLMCVCACGACTHNVFPDKNKSDRISKCCSYLQTTVCLQGDERWCTTQWGSLWNPGSMQHIKVVSDIFFYYFVALCCLAAWWWKFNCAVVVRRQLISLHADTECCVPAWTDDNCPWLRPYGGASEEQTGTGGNEHPIIHHRRFADTPQKASHSSAHPPNPSSGRPAIPAKAKIVSALRWSAKTFFTALFHSGCFVSFLS